MSASNWLLARAGLAIAALLPLLPLSGCAKEVKAEFPRPPASASTAPPMEAPPEEAPAPEEPRVVAENEEPEIEPPAPPSAPPPARRSPAPPAPEEPVEEAPPETVPSTQLAGSEPVDPDLAEKLDRASSLLGAIGGRSLTADQNEQLTAARAFVLQARRALRDGDPRRALVLIDKGLILAQDVERLSRR